jgi:regulator of sigma E protease
LSGPVGIAQATSDASTSWDGIISLAAILSISVGFLNLLPLPPFDGGQMVLALVEMIRSGKRLSIRVQMIANAMGMSVILLLVGTAFYMDLKRNGERATRMKQSSSQNAPAK